MFQRKQSSGTICLVASSPTEFSEDFASLLEWEVFSKSTSRLQFNRTNTFLRPRLASRDHYGRTSATTNFLALKSFELENSNIRNLDLRCLDLGGPFFSLSVPLSLCPSLSLSFSHSLSLCPSLFVFLSLSLSDSKCLLVPFFLFICLFKALQLFSSLALFSCFMLIFLSLCLCLISLDGFLWLPFLCPSLTLSQSLVLSLFLPLPLSVPVSHLLSGKLWYHTLHFPLVSFTITN